jgi:hypothetical protein
MDVLPPNNPQANPSEANPSGAGPSDAPWTPELKAEFIRRRRGRNIALLLAMIGLCLLIYAIAVVKLARLGHMW